MNHQLIFCLFKGRRLANAFEVDLLELGDNKSLLHLKQLIKEKVKELLKGVDPSFLTLYSVSIPCLDSTIGVPILNEAYRQIEQGTIRALGSSDVIGDVFAFPHGRHIHLILTVPGKLSSGVLIFTYRLHPPALAHPFLYTCTWPC
jgi:hypothetical protein